MIPPNRAYCFHCAYDLTDLPSGRCPECGVPFEAERVAPPGPLA